jgi:hypothetical protein
MNASPQTTEQKNPKTGMTHAEMKQFIRNHFEEFVNRRNIRIGELNFAPSFVDHGADVPPGPEKSSRPPRNHRRPHRRRRQSSSPQPLERH